MASREIVLWLDERWHKALSVQLGERSVEERLNQCLDALTRQLPKEQYERISKEIQTEEQAYRQEHEDARQFSAFCVKEHGQECYFQWEATVDLLNAASTLRRYLRQEPGWTADSYAALFRSWERITAEGFERLAKLRMENPQKVTGVYDLDFDRQEFSTIHPTEGWSTYTMKAVSTGVYHACRSVNRSSDRRWEQLMNHLCGKEITSAGHLSAKDISLAKEICEIDGHLLNFYIEADFDVDAVFGTHVCTAENDDTLNVYADYDCASGQVCDELEVDLHRADGREGSVPYRLNAAEKMILLRKMEDYCQQRTGMSLKDYSAQLMAEDIAPPFRPTM